MMKKATRVAMGSLLALTLGIGIIPAVTHAAAPDSLKQNKGFMHRPMEHGRGFGGLVSAVNTATNTITFSLPARGDKPATTATFTYPDSTIFMKDKAVGDESTIAVGDKVRLDNKFSVTDGVISSNDVIRILTGQSKATQIK